MIFLRSMRNSWTCKWDVLWGTPDPFYGASIAELQFTDSGIYYSEPAMLMMYYNDALSLAAQVLAPLRALPRLCWLIMSLLMKSKAFYLPLLETKLMITLSMTLWLAMWVSYPFMLKESIPCSCWFNGTLPKIHHHAIDAKHMYISNIRQSFSQILSSANLHDEENVVLRLDHHSYDKEAHGGFKTEVPASLNVPLNERNLFIADKARCVDLASMAYLQA